MFVSRADTKNVNVLRMSTDTLKRLCRYLVFRHCKRLWKSQKYRTITFFMDRKAIAYELEEDGMKVSGFIAQTPVPCSGERRRSACFSSPKS